ncbi:MAG: SUMF1/EgtB/PvdO family nonheme iron enzyme [Anaerolineales bacterium]|nr:SUMF1/EgtB/PvdO family nonheme iron enzyme [Anaerolineales bacterium]
MPTLLESYQTLVDRLLPWLSRQFPQLFYRYRYHQHLLIRHKIFDVTGLITTGESPLESERIFVPLHLAPQSVNRITTSVIGNRDDEEKRQEIWNYIGGSQAETQHVAIIAGPGFGKSTLLRHIALRSIAKRPLRQEMGIPYRLPIFLSLRDHAAAIRRVDAVSAQVVTDSISPAVYQKLRQTLSKCEAFESNASLRSKFVQAAINPWFNRVPAADSVIGRVEGVIRLLHDKYREDTEQNALVLFVQILAEQHDPAEAIRDELLQVVHELANELIMVRQKQSPVPDAQFNQEYNLHQAIDQDLKKYSGPISSPQWFARHLRQGGCFVLLDGLDEIPDSLTRKQVAAWSEAQMMAYPKNQFILSSRPNSYKQAQVNRFHVLEVMSFNAQQIEDFVRNWYLAVELADVVVRTSVKEEAAREKAKQFLENIFKNDSLFKLATNPLLLTMMIYVHYYRSVLPKRRADLFHEVIQVLFSRRDYLPTVPAQQRRMVLQPLAYEMMQQRVQELLTKEVLQIINPVLREQIGRTSGAGFLQAVESNTGLLKEENNRSYRFAHLTFQEYLAAVHVEQHGLIQNLVDHIADEWWHETIRLYCAQADGTLILRACLADGRLSELTFQLALHCLDESESISPKIQPRLEKVIYRCLANKELTSIIANAFVEIRKGRMVRIAAKKFIDPKLITHAEYQVFLHEKKQEGTYHQPDHWLTTNFPQNLARRPVVGVRLEDAISFCSWLTENEGAGQWRFRLPKVAELQGRGFFGLQIEEAASYWVQDRGQHTCLGGQLKPTLNLGRVQKQVLADVQLDNAQYPIDSIFPAGRQMVLPQTLRLYLEAFDFSQFNSRQHLQAIHAYARNLLTEADTVANMIEPLAQHFDREAKELGMAVQQIEAHLREGQAKIYSLEAERDAALNEITAAYAEPYNHIEQQLQQANNAMEDQRHQQREIETERKALVAKIDGQRQQLVEQVQDLISQTEAQARSANEAVQIHYEKQYQDMDAVKGHIQAEINKLESMRGMYTDESINRVIGEQRVILSDIEKERRRLKRYEEEAYEHVATEKKGIMVTHRTQLDEFEQQAKIAKEQIQKHHEENAAILKQNIDTIQAGITQLKGNRRQLEQEEQQQKANVSAQAKERIAAINIRIGELSARQNKYKVEEQSFRQKAEFVRESKAVLTGYARTVLELVLTLDGFLADYFSANAAHVIRIGKNLKLINSRFEELLRLCQQYIESPEQSSPVRYLKSALRGAEAAKETVFALQQYVENAELLNHLLTDVCKEFRMLTFGDLPQVVVDNEHQALYRSLELSYNFLRYRGREQRPKETTQAVYDQLHYVRLCVLGLLSTCVVKGVPDRTKMVQLVRLYVSFYALLARIKGEVPAFEGIRLIKERVVSRRTDKVTGR